MVYLAGDAQSDHSRRLRATRVGLVAWLPNKNVPNRDFDENAGYDS
ncbi:MAG: hypothetical protein WCD69_08025 [Xanthobacteraceae bacterium]